MWKPFAALFVLCLAASTVRVADAKTTTIDTPIHGRPTCIAVTTSTRMDAPGYDHMVTLTSRCKKDAVCVVSTDVAPEPLSISVPKGESVDVMTFRASPASEFKAKVDCTGGV